MSLVLEIEFLLGVCFAARNRNDAAPDWPPQPDRVFSALTASWAGDGDAGRVALTWLEAQAPPVIEATPCTLRAAPQTFVPPNDAVTLPEKRQRQPRRFPAALPLLPLVRLVWQAEPPAPILESLQALAHDTAAVGHSASLTRCRFLIEDDQSLHRVVAVSDAPRRVIHAGRLATLEAAYAAGRRPPSDRSVIDPSPRPGLIPPRSHMGEDWIVLAHADGPMPALTAIARLAGKLRRALISAFGDVPIPPEVSGHKADGTAVEGPHLAILPLAYVGHEHADGHLMGLALALPRWVETGCRLESFDPAAAALRTALQGAIAALMTRTGRSDQPLIRLTNTVGQQDTWLRVETGVSSAASLRPQRWCATAQVWASATPVVLNRHLKQTGAARDAEIRAQIADACTHIGLPRPDETRGIALHKHAAPHGAPSARRAARGQPWGDWTVPEKYASRWRTHVVVDFGQPVSGPVVLGAARHLGLGLCLPLIERPGT